MTEIIIILICLSLNAIFASIEMAFVTIRIPELRQRAKKGDSVAIRLLELRKSPERYLSVIQIGITLVGAISAAVGGAGAEETLSPFFENRFGFSEDAAEAVSILLVVIPITYLSVVLGELVPKTIALRYPSQVLSFGTHFLVIGSKTLGPLVNIFESSTKLILRLVLRKQVSDTEQPDKSEVDLSSMASNQRQYILNLANIERKKIKDIYLQWSQVSHIQFSDSFEQVLHIVLKSGHTRLPVLNKNTVNGILHSKEFLSFASSGNRDWQSIIRAANTIHPTDDLLNVLQTLQQKRRHMAIVVSGQQILGIVTLEDIMEEIVGDIFDEDDDGLIEKLLSQRSQSRLRRR